MQDTFRWWLNSRRWLIWITTRIPPSKLNQLKPIMSFQVTKPTQMGSRLKYPIVEEARAQQLTPRWWVECVHLSMLKSMSNYALCNFRATWRTKPSHGTILTCTLAIKPEGRNSRIYSARYLWARGLLLTTVVPTTRISSIRDEFMWQPPRAASTATSLASRIRWQFPGAR